MEATLKLFAETWKDIQFDFDKHKGSDVMLTRMNEDNFDLLEEH